MEKKKTGGLGPEPEESTNVDQGLDGDAAEQEASQQQTSDAQETPFWALPSTEPVLDPLLPASMAEVAKPIGRDAVQQQLRQHLTGKGVVLAAINGLPGVGKTTLAVELAHNEEIRRHFTEGVLWAGLGPAPDMFALLSHWCTYARLDLACPLHFHHLLQPSSTMFYPELYR